MMSVRSISETDARMVRVRSRIVIRCSSALDGGLKRWNRRLDSVHGGNDVRSRLPEDDHVDRWFAVEEPGLAHRLLRIDHLRNVLQPNRAAVVIPDHQRLVIGGLGDLIVGHNVGRLTAVEELAFRQIRILSGHHLLHGGQADPVAGKLGGVELNAYGGQGRSHYQHFAHARDLRYALLHHRGCFVVEVGNVVDVRLQAQHHDRRIGRVHLAIGGISRKIRGKIGARGIDAGLHVARRSVNITAEIEL